MMRLDRVRASLAKHGLWIAALAVVAVVTVLVATQNGLNLNWDSGKILPVSPASPRNRRYPQIHMNRFPYP